MFGKPTISPAFPSIILTATAADVIAAYGAACSDLGSETDPREVERKYGSYLNAKYHLCAYVESLENQAESVVNQSHNYTRIRF